MHKKRLISVLLMFLLVLSLLTFAQADVEEQSSCSGFWGSLSCFLWGNPENRVGRGWFEGRNVVGGAWQCSNGFCDCTGASPCSGQGGQSFPAGSVNIIQGLTSSQSAPASSPSPTPASSSVPALRLPSGHISTTEIRVGQTIVPTGSADSVIVSNVIQNQDGSMTVIGSSRGATQRYIIPSAASSVQLVSPSPPPSGTPTAPPATPPAAAPPAPAPAPVPAAAPGTVPSTPTDYPVGGEYRNQQNQIVLNLYYGPDGQPVRSGFFIERANPIAENIRPGYSTVNTATPGGVATYTYADDSMLHVYPNGESSLVRQDNSGNDIFRIDYGTDGSRHLTLSDGFQRLEGDYNDNDLNRNIVEVLYNQKFLTEDQYEDIKGTGIPFGAVGEEKMSTVLTMLESNAALRSDLAKPGETSAAETTVATASPAPTPAPPPRPLGLPDGSKKIDGTEYSLGLDGEFYTQDGKKVNAHQLVQQQRITHDQAYNMLDARARQSESNVLRDLPGGTQVNDQGNTYEYNRQTNRWTNTKDNKPAPAGLSAAVVQGEAQIQPHILGGLPGGTFKIGNQPYTFDGTNWHTGGADGPVIPAAELQTKVLDPKAVVDNVILKQRIKQLNDNKAITEDTKRKRQEADSQMWAGSWFEGIQTSRGYQNIKQYASTAGDIASVMASGGKYQALSNALFGRETSRTWFLNADSEFFTTWANLPSYAATHGPLAPEACELDDARRTEIPGSSSQFVQTAGGSYQFVGAIQAEKTATTQPILCKRNEDPEMEAEFACRTGQVCVEDEFCHADADSDKEPDSEQPAQGYFYKITWGVAAPFDESFTPYIDEDNKAVKFNIQLIAEDGTSIWLYSRAGVTGTGVIALENGDRDRNVITHFSSRIFQKACIRYDPRYLVKDRDGTKVEDQCVDIIVRNSGSVEFGSSRRTQSVTTASSEVSSNTDW